MILRVVFVIHYSVLADTYDFVYVSKKLSTWAPKIYQALGFQTTLH